ncbi:MAG TPA: hypothetical protein VJB66_01820 [Candidatus Nanoarchaeia archaeon]|nr:hypothetical protein [Candidatus Nanoarchaeia archaeon]
MDDFRVPGRVTYAGENTIIVQYVDSTSRYPIEHAVALYSTGYARPLSLDQTVSMAIQYKRLVVCDDSGMPSYHANTPDLIMDMKAKFEKEKARVHAQKLNGSGGGQ